MRRTLIVAATFSVLALSPGRGPSHEGNAMAAPKPPHPGTTPPPPGPCEPHLTRAADLTITMVANDAFYKSTLNVANKPPQTFQSPTSPSVRGGCTRSVVDVVVPSNASSGCNDCYAWAEISMGAAQFTSSKSWENHFYTMKESVAEAYCKSYRHQISVYRKKNGAAKFGASLKFFDYRGRWENNKCRVYALNQGTIHDTTEVYAPVTPPSSGTDVYRVVHLLQIDGANKNSITVVEFESMRE